MAIKTPSRRVAPHARRQTPTRPLADRGGANGRAMSASMRSIIAVSRPHARRGGGSRLGRRRAGYQERPDPCARRDHPSLQDRGGDPDQRQCRECGHTAPRPIGAERLPHPQIACATTAKATSFSPAITPPSAPASATPCGECPDAREGHQYEGRQSKAEEGHGPRPRRREIARSESLTASWRGRGQIGTVRAAPRTPPLSASRDPSRRRGGSTRYARQAAKARQPEFEEGGKDLEQRCGRHEISN